MTNQAPLGSWILSVLMGIEILCWSRIREVFERMGTLGHSVANQQRCRRSFNAAIRPVVKRSWDLI